MATFSRISLDEARSLVTGSRQRAHNEYREYLRQLDRDTAGHITLTDEDRPITIRARLKAAAKAENLDLEIQRKGDKIVFWLRDAEAEA